MYFSVIFIAKKRTYNMLGPYNGLFLRFQVIFMQQQPNIIQNLL